MLLPISSDLSHKEIDERARTNFDHPDSIETELLISDIQSLKRGAQIDVPTYCFQTHCRKDETTREEPKRIILVEGILLFTHPELRNELDVMVFVVSVQNPSYA